MGRVAGRWTGCQLPCENLIASAQKIESATSVRILTSMHSRVFHGQSFGISIVPLFNNCHLFQENEIVLVQRNYDFQSRVSVDSFRTFVGAIGGTEPDITDNNARDLNSFPPKSGLLHSPQQSRVGGRCVSHRTQVRS
jgi:hypothetical protein